MSNLLYTANRPISSSGYHCCVPLCTSDSRRHANVSFHKFPAAKPLQSRWIHAIRRDPGPLFKITASTCVCSHHFKPEDFKYTPVRKTLRPGAVPSIFNWTTDQPTRRKLVKIDTTPVKPCAIPAEQEDQIDDTMEIDENLRGNECETPAPTMCCPEKDARILELEKLLKEKESIIQSKIERFGVERFGHDDNMFLFYSGFSTIKMFYGFFNFLRLSAETMTSHYHTVSEGANPRLVGRQRNMLLVDELFMFLTRLKCGLFEQDLAVRFGIHVCTVSRKIITWTNFLYFVLGGMDIWPSREKIFSCMPNVFRTMYPRTRIIIDCTELKTERPSSLALGSRCYSSYKSSHTWKGLVGIAPHGALTFVSILYTGSISDIEITKLSGLLELLEPGDEIMADKGFNLKKVLEDTGVNVTTPPFLMNQGQFTSQQVEDTQTIAKLRIHIERHIRRVKEYHLFDGIIPLSMVGTINQLWAIANLLTLFRGPLVKDWSC